MIFGKKYLNMIRNRALYRLIFIASYALYPLNSYSSERYDSLLWNGYDFCENICQSGKAVDFSDVKIPHAKVKNANFTCVKFSRAKVSHVDFQDANLTCADFTDADLSNSNLTGANIIGIKLKGAKLKGAYAKELKVNGSLISDFRTKKTPFHVLLRNGHDEFKGLYFIGDDLENAELTKQNFQLIDLNAQRFKNDLSIELVNGNRLHIPQIFGTFQQDLLQYISTFLFPDSRIALALSNSEMRSVIKKSWGLLSHFEIGPQQPVIKTLRFLLQNVRNLKLQTLVVSNRELSDDELKWVTDRFQNLKKLSLNSNVLTDAAIPHLSSLKDLIYLELGANHQLTENGKQELRGALQDCQITMD